MEKFSDLEYVRVNLETFKREMDELLLKFDEALSAKEQLEIFSLMTTISNHAETMCELGVVRFTLNTKDEFYEKERDYIDDLYPELTAISTDIYKKMLNSKFREGLEADLGSLYFKKAEYSLKTYSDDVKDLLKKENKLGSDYDKLLSSASILYKGKKRNLEQLKSFMVDDDRMVRRESNELYFGFMSENMSEFDRIYDELVKVRHEIATKLGFNDFVELGYLRMERMDYDQEMVKVFRKQVIEEIVPIATKLRNRQAKRLGVDKLEYSDINYMFTSGNPKPQGNPEWIVDQGRKMYEELSEDTSVFYKFMIDHELIDLVAKPGKSGGGYCTYFNDFKAPFVFSNFNGTEGDITVLTHEMGHAFQSYKSSHIPQSELRDPTLESCEIHSMSMEFLTYPWMEIFFEGDNDKFKFMHMSDGLLFIPYGVLVDAFQHYIYENPTYTPKERRAKWRELEKIYLPTLSYEGNEYLSNGGYWQKQSHIYQDPFYYIDYTLAQICAYQFFVRDLKDHESTWKDYVTLCSAGGSKSFLGLVELANLKSPFEEGVIKDIIKVIDEKLEAIDDTSF